MTAVVRDRQFDELVRAHRRAIYAYARSMTGSDDLADDVTQDTFLRAWRYLDSFRGTGSFEGWLIRICRRCVFDLAAARPSVEQLRPDDLASANDGAGPTVETALLLQQMRPAHREVLVLCGLLGYDYDSAAAVLDVPVGTVRSRLHRARATLASLLVDRVEDGIA